MWDQQSLKSMFESTMKLWWKKKKIKNKLQQWKRIPFCNNASFCPRVIITVIICQSYKNAYQSRSKKCPITEQLKITLAILEAFAKKKANIYPQWKESVTVSTSSGIKIVAIHRRSNYPPNNKRHNRKYWKHKLCDYKMWTLNTGDVTVCK